MTSPPPTVGDRVLIKLRIARFKLTGLPRIKTRFGPTLVHGLFKSIKSLTTLSIRALKSVGRMASLRVSLRAKIKDVSMMVCIFESVSKIPPRNSSSLIKFSKRDHMRLNASIVQRKSCGTTSSKSEMVSPRPTASAAGVRTDITI